MSALIILASKSAARRALLESAGVPFKALGSGVAEDVVKRRLKGAPVRDIATALAEAKALAVSRANPQAYVIGADQILSLNGEPLDKPADKDEARARILALSGVTHVLETSAVVARGARILWRGHAAPTLLMRQLKTEEIDAYMAAARTSIIESVGAYQLEDVGVRLFERIDGAYADILGLPMTPLLRFLRGEGLLSF